MAASAQRCRLPTAGFSGVIGRQSAWVRSVRSAVIRQVRRSNGGSHPSCNPGGQAHSSFTAGRRPHTVKQAKREGARTRLSDRCMDSMAASSARLLPRRCSSLVGDT